jgi:predicted ATPase
MTKIRIVEIENFRGIKKLYWRPAAGINCLIGPGDSGKSSLLEAIDLCLGARRAVNLSDADFNGAKTEETISISLTIGELEESTKRLDTYRQFLRGFDVATGVLEDESGSGLETVITLTLKIGDDLDPQWTLYSDRANALGLTRNITWGDRQQLAPVRIGHTGDAHLSWRRGSVLQRLSDETLNLIADFASISRDARTAFGNRADDQLKETLKVVGKCAHEVGIDVGEGVKALLDSQSVSLGSGSIAIHDQIGVPLSARGTGSRRLLVMALQREVTAKTGIILLDEMEHGLEPHRIHRLVKLLGAKENPCEQQVFVTTHSPVALKEFSAEQLFVVRRSNAECKILNVGNENSLQSAVRKHPEAFLAPSVLICEGVSEVGLMRGLSLSFMSQGSLGLEALGVALVNGGGGSPSDLVSLARLFVSLGYRTAILMDSDVAVDAEAESTFKANGGRIVRWEGEQALEDALFNGLPDEAIDALITRAAELQGEHRIEHCLSVASGGLANLKSLESERSAGQYTKETRALLGSAARIKSKSSGKSGWFKTLGAMEDVALDIVLPHHKGWSENFRGTIQTLWAWVNGAD